MSKKSPLSHRLSGVLVFCMILVGLYQLYMGSPFRFHLMHTLGLQFHFGVQSVPEESAFFFILAVLNLIFIRSLHHRVLAWPGS